MKAVDPTGQPTNNSLNPAGVMQWMVVVCGGIGAALGVVALLGWVTGLSLLASLGRGHVAMLPASAISLGLLGLSLALLASPASRRGAARGASLLVLPVLLWSYLYLISYFTGLYQTPEKYLTPEKESPISAACFLMMGLAVYFLASTKARASAIHAGPALAKRAPSLEPFFPGGFAAACATVVALANLIGALGYAYGTPLLYGSLIAPTALPATLALLVMSGGLILAAGPSHWPLRPLTGTSAQAVLLRHFLPVTAAAVLIGGACNSN